MFTLAAVLVGEDPGSQVYVREYAQAVRGADGAILYYEGAVEDITPSLAADQEQQPVDRGEREGQSQREGGAGAEQHRAHERLRTRLCQQAGDDLGCARRRRA